MRNTFWTQAARFLRLENKRRRWVMVVSCLAAAVAVLTVRILTVQSMAQTYTRRELDCAVVIHWHDKDCYDEDGNLICGKADYVAHVHNDDCYDEEGNLVCFLPEIPPHVHTEDCFATENVLICPLEEGEDHQHTDACYEEHKVVICGQPGLHRHTEDCYKEQKVLICPLEEGEDHQHTDDCYEIHKNLICGQIELLEHVHGEECFRFVEMTAEELDQQSGQEEPVTEEGDGESAGDEIAGEPAEEETASGEPAEEETTGGEPTEAETADSEPSEAVTAAPESAEPTQTPDEALTADAAGENVTEAALDAAGQDPETAQEGPTEAARAEASAPEGETEARPATVSFVQKVQGITVRVEAPEGAFPEGTTMKVALVEEQEIRDAVNGAVEKKVSRMKAVDITFYDPEGQEVQPLVPIQVSIDTGEPQENERSQVVHVDQDGNADLVEDVQSQGEDGTVVFDADHFSIYALISTIS